MSITKTLLAGVAGTVLVGSGAMAGEPLELTETQMDDVTAGVVFSQAFAGDVVGGGFGTVTRQATVFSEAFEELKVNPTPPIFSIVERGTATADLTATFGGVGFLFSGGTSALVFN